MENLRNHKQITTQKPESHRRHVYRYWMKTQPVKTKTKNEKAYAGLCDKVMKGFVMKTNKRKPMRLRKNTRFKEPILTVPCPRHVQRRMWKSLRKAAASNINLDGKIRARELIAMAEASPEPAKPDNKSKAIAAKTDATQILSGQGTFKATAAAKLQPARNIFMRCVQQVSSFIKNRGRFHGNNSRRQQQQ